MQAYIEPVGSIKSKAWCCFGDPAYNGRA